MNEVKYAPKDIASAHEKQGRAARPRGQGGVKFTPLEQEILNNHVNLPEENEE